MAFIKHKKVVTKPASTTDTGNVHPSDWNDDHSVEGYLVSSGNPNGVLTGTGEIALDKLNSQLWINVGGTTWIALARADGSFVPPRILYALWTDSNGMGVGTNTFEGDAGPVLASNYADKLASTYSNVVLTKLYTDNFVEPQAANHIFNMGTAQLRAENINVTPGFGPEIIIGRMLDELINGPGATPDSRHKIWLDQFSIHSSKLADHVQGSTAGNSSPLLGGGNLDSDANNRTLTAAAASGRTPAVAFVMLCTNDASDATATGNIPTNLPAFIARKRAIHGSQLLFVWVVMQSTLPGGTFPQVSTARANQIAALQAATGTAIVYAEDIPTVDDLAHYASVGQHVLAQRQATAAIRLQGLRERVVTAATVVGFSPATWNGSTHGQCGFTGVPGANLRGWPWQASADGDIMFMPVFKGTVGAGSAIPIPSGWTQALAVTNTDSATVENRTALFWKQCAQSELDTNVVSTGGPGFPITLTITPGGAQFAVKPFTVRSASKFPTVGTPVGTTHTTVDTTPVTATGVSSTAGQTVFVLVTGWSAIGQSFTVTNGSVSSLTQVFGAAYPSSSGNYLYIGLWQCTASGASGNFTVTPTLNSSSTTIVWAMS